MPEKIRTKQKASYKLILVNVLSKSYKCFQKVTLKTCYRESQLACIKCI